MIFAIKSEKFEHKDQIIELDFSEMKIISDIDFVSTTKVTIAEWVKIQNTNTPDVNAYKYEGKSVWIKYLGLSRIDGFPIFQIDTTQLDREEKINSLGI